MRIGMILDKTFPPDPRVENEAKALIHEGFEVYLFCLHYTSGIASLNIKGIEVRRYASSKLEYKLSALAYTVPFYTYLMSLKIKHFLVENEIDIVHIHDMRIAQAVFKVNKKLQLKVVLDLHDNFPEVMKEYPHLQKFPGKQLISPKKWKEKEEIFMLKANKVITVSGGFIEEIKSRSSVPKENLVLVPNTVSRSFYEDAIIEKEVLNRYRDDFVLLYVGDTGLRRGLLTVIEAMPLLTEQINNLKFVVVGENSTDEVLKNKVKELELEKFVDFEGWQDVGRFPSYIEASNVCLSPLIRSIQHDVAYANKIFQYMSFSKPLLVSNATEQRKLVEFTGSGLVHKEKDPVDFSEKVMQLYRDPKMSKAFGARGKKFIEEEFVWEKVSQGLCDMYRELEDH